MKGQKTGGRIRVADKLGGRALRVIFHLLKVRRLRGPLMGARWQ